MGVRHVTARKDRDQLGWFDANDYFHNFLFVRGSNVQHNVYSTCCTANHTRAQRLEYDLAVLSPETYLSCLPKATRGFLAPSSLSDW